MMRYHFCEIRTFSDRLYLPGDLNSDLLQRKYYKESGIVGNRPGIDCMFRMKLYLNMKLFSNFISRNDSIPHIELNLMTKHNLSQSVFQSKKPFYSAKSRKRINISITSPSLRRATSKVALCYALAF